MLCVSLHQAEIKLILCFLSWCSRFTQSGGDIHPCWQTAITSCCLCLYTFIPFLCLSVCLSVCLPSCLSVCLSVSLSVHVSVVNHNHVASNWKHPLVRSHIRVRGWMDGGADGGWMCRCLERYLMSADGMIYLAKKKKKKKKQRDEMICVWKGDDVDQQRRRKRWGDKTTGWGDRITQLRIICTWFTGERQMRCWLMSWEPLQREDILFPQVWSACECQPIRGEKLLHEKDLKQVGQSSSHISLLVGHSQQLKQLTETTLTCWSWAGVMSTLLTILVWFVNMLTLTQLKHSEHSPGNLQSNPALKLTSTWTHTYRLTWCSQLSGTDHFKQLSVSCVVFFCFCVCVCVLM